MKPEKLKSLLELDFQGVQITRRGNLWTLAIKGDHPSLSVAKMSGMESILNGHDIKLGTYDITSTWEDNDPLTAILTACVYVSAAMKVLIEERDEENRKRATK